MRKDSEILTSRFAASMARAGITPVGIGWPNAPELASRFEVLFSGLDMSSFSRDRPLRLLDLGCGPGFLLDWLSINGLIDMVDYTGVDVTELTMHHARTRWPKHRFLLRDLRDSPFAPNSFDYCIICGVFTARYENSYTQMLNLVTDTILSVWPSTTMGLAFNVMSKHVDWERDDLFHWPLDDIMAFCKEKLSRHVSLRLDYGPWETSAIVMRNPLQRWSKSPEEWGSKV